MRDPFNVRYWSERDEVPSVDTRFVGPIHPVAAYYGRPNWTGEQISEQISDLASDVLPTLWADDPTDAVEAVTNLLLTQWAALQGDDVDDSTPSIFRPLPEVPLEPMTPDKADGELGDARAWAPVADVIGQTLKVMPRLDGQYRTARQGMWVQGDTGSGHTAMEARALRRRADLLLAAHYPTERKDWALIVSAFGEDSVEPHTVAHRPEATTLTTALRTWQTTGTARRIIKDDQGNRSMVVGDTTWCDVERTVSVGADIAPGLSGAKSRVAQLKPRLRVASYPASGTRFNRDQVTHSVTRPDYGPTPGRYQGAVIPGTAVAPWCSTSTVQGLTTRYNGATIIGHGNWVHAASRKQGTRAERTVRSATYKAKQTGEPVTSEEAATVASLKAMEMANARHAAQTAPSHALQQTKSTQASANRAPSTQTSKFLLPCGTTITIALPTSGTRFNVRLALGAKSYRANARTPEQVASAVRNGLRALSA